MGDGYAFGVFCRMSHNVDKEFTLSFADKINGMCSSICVNESIEYQHSLSDNKLLNEASIDKPPVVFDNAHSMFFHEFIHRKNCGESVDSTYY